MFALIIKTKSTRTPPTPATTTTASTKTTTTTTTAARSHCSNSSRRARRARSKGESSRTAVSKRAATRVLRSRSRRRRAWSQRGCRSRRAPPASTWMSVMWRRSVRWTRAHAPRSWPWPRRSRCQCRPSSAVVKGSEPTQVEDTCLTSLHLALTFFPSLSLILSFFSNSKLLNLFVLFVVTGLVESKWVDFRIGSVRHLSCVLVGHLDVWLLFIFWVFG